MQADAPDKIRAGQRDRAAPQRGIVTHLDGGGAPLDEVGQLALANALQALVHLRRIHLALRFTASSLLSKRFTFTALRSDIHLSDTSVDIAPMPEVIAITSLSLRECGLL